MLAVLLAIGSWQIVWVQLSYVPPKFPEGYAVLGDAAALQLVQGFLPALSPALLLCLMRPGGYVTALPLNVWILLARTADHAAANVILF